MLDLGCGSRAARPLLATIVALLLLPGTSARADDPCAVRGPTILASGSGLGGTGVLGGGVGGTGVREEGGLGGTGHRDEGGVGGTGHGDEGGVGGTGIFGTLTGFGSLCVNGLRVQYDADATVIVRGVAGALPDLAPGQVVWLLANRSGEGLHTDRIEVVSAVLGPIAGIDPVRRRLVAGGRVVDVPVGVPIVEKPGAVPLLLDDLAPGDRLDVAALPGADGRLIASRIERHRERPEGRARLSEIREILRRGRGFARLSVEGYARAAGSERVQLSGLEVQLRDVARPERDARVLAEGPVIDRVLHVERLQVRPQGTDGALRPGGDRPKPGGGGQEPSARPATPQPPPEPSAAPSRPERGEPSPGGGSLQPERVELPERVERPELPDRPERPSRPERPAVEKPERIERPSTDLIAPRSAIDF